MTKLTYSWMIPDTANAAKTARNLDEVHLRAGLYTPFFKPLCTSVFHLLPQNSDGDVDLNIGLWTISSVSYSYKRLYMRLTPMEL